MYKKERDQLQKTIYDVATLFENMDSKNLNTEFIENMVIISGLIETIPDEEFAKVLSSIKKTKKEVVAYRYGQNFCPELYYRNTHNIDTNSEEIIEKFLNYTFKNSRVYENKKDDIFIIKIRDAFI